MSRVVYLHRITDGAYFIYKLSNYDRMSSIRLIDAGLAYNRLQNYSEKFKKKFKKYDLEKYDDYTHVLSDSYEDFLHRIYINVNVKTRHKHELVIPSRAYEIIESVGKRKQKERLKNIKY